MIAMALLAAYVPMRRATRVGPHGSVATRVDAAARALNHKGNHENTKTSGRRDSPRCPCLCGLCGLCVQIVSLCLCDSLLDLLSKRSSAMKPHRFAGLGLIGMLVVT